MDKRLKMPSALAKFTLNFTLVDGEPAVCTMFMVHTTGSILALLNTTNAAAFDDGKAAQQAHNLAVAWSGTLNGVQSNNTVLESVDWVWNESVDAGPLHEGTETATPLPIAGSAGPSPLDNGLAICVREQTGLGGRSNHGRFFVPGIELANVSSTDPNQLSADAYAAVNGAAASFLSAWNNNDLLDGVGDAYAMVVASFIQNGAERATAVYEPVSSLDVRNKYLDFQRRRAPGHNRHH